MVLGMGGSQTIDWDPGNFMQGVLHTTVKGVDIVDLSPESEI